jgi:CMP-N-acetylneuraminic acid synthetase
MDSVVISSGVLAIIPARGGSKSIPRKNIRNFAGHPLIAYSIAAGLAAKTVDRVIVSTDDEEIAAIARRYGAETPFLRPPEISQDDTPDLPVFHHTLTWLGENERYRPDIVVHLRPTSPLRKTWHIEQAVLRLHDRPEADAIRTVCTPFQNPFKMWRIDREGFLQPLLETGIHEAYNQPRQSLPEVYWQTGYVDVTWSETILKSSSMTGNFILPLIITAEEWIDIDTPDDWSRAERLIENGEITLGDLGYEIVEKN